MYVADERFKKNIDKYGEGTAEFAAETIAVYNYATARFLRIEGARVEVEDECFEGLIEGTSL